MKTNLLDTLYAFEDQEYASLQRKLIPGVSADSVIGVRTPQLRKIAKEMVKNGEGEAFLEALPHRYFEENQLHAFILSEEKDLNRCIEKLEAFLPYVDNWATCDQMSPKVFKKDRTDLLPYVHQWILSQHAYTVRFGIKMLMDHYLDEDFEPAYLEEVAGIRSENYYIRMMAAWYFATALYKQYNAALPFIKEKRLEPWTHRKAIQKALESDRITPEQKQYLKQFKGNAK